MHGMITAQWTEWVIKGDKWKSVLVIQTSLETNPSAPAFDRARIEEMLVRAMDGIGDSIHDHVQVVPKSVGQ